MTDDIFSSEEITLAGLNYEAQEKLADALYRAFKDSGLRAVDISEYLGVTVEKANEIITGYYDLTLTELRYLAAALNVQVSYKVSAVGDISSDAADDATPETHLYYRREQLAERLHYALGRDDWGSANEEERDEMLDAADSLIADNLAFTAEKNKLFKVSEDNSKDAVLDAIVREAFRDRGNRVPDWDADETEAYRSNGGFQEGNDAVLDIRVQKIKNLLKESGLLK